MIIGIDLGTTNSLVAAWTEDGAKIVPNALGEALTPSVVGLDDTGEVLVGRAARERQITHPDRTAAAFKRHMGTDRQIRMDRRDYRPEELSALVLKSLKADAEAAFGGTVSEAVISVPAYFNDTQRKATRIAGEMAGLTVERLVNEPTAAAMAYGLHQRDAESKFLVFDLGGGTFDVSVLELFAGIMEVRASTGDNFLGGEDFVDRLVQGFMDVAAAPAGLGAGDLAGAALQALRDQAERAKRRFSDRETTEMRLRWGDRTLAWTVSEDTFEHLTSELMGRLSTPIERALRDSRIKPGELDEVVLIGGATRMPIVRRLVARMFGRIPASHFDPDQAVALGAAVQAGLKARHAALDEVVVTDVCPYTLGLQVGRPIGTEQVQEGLFLPLIERNTTIPASRIETLWPIHDRQSAVDVDVYQGESRTVAGNIRLGKLRVQLPRGAVEDKGVDVRFTYDVNGLLEVEANVQATGEQHRMIIEQTPGAMSEKEIAERMKTLEALKIHPRDKAENRAVLARAERLYEESLGEDRQRLDLLMVHFESVLAGQDPEQVANARERLAAALDEFEGESYF